MSQGDFCYTKYLIGTWFRGYSEFHDFGEYFAGFYFRDLAKKYVKAIRKYIKKKIKNYVSCEIKDLRN